jgi:hypothetical protein
MMVVMAVSLRHGGRRERQGRREHPCERDPSSHPKASFDGDPFLHRHDPSARPLITIAGRMYENLQTG